MVLITSPNWPPPTTHINCTHYTTSNTHQLYSLHHQTGLHLHTNTQQLYSLHHHTHQLYSLHHQTLHHQTGTYINCTHYITILAYTYLTINCTLAYTSHTSTVLITSPYWPTPTTHINYSLHQRTGLHLQHIKNCTHCISELASTYNTHQLYSLHHQTGLHLQHTSTVLITSPNWPPPTTHINCTHCISELASTHQLYCRVIQCIK